MPTTHGRNGSARRSLIQASVVLGILVTLAVVFLYLMPGVPTWVQFGGYLVGVAIGIQAKIVVDRYIDVRDG